MKIKKLLIMFSFLLLPLAPALAALDVTGSKPLDITSGSGKTNILTRLNASVGTVFNQTTTDATLLEYIGTVISVLFSLFGTIFVFLFIFAGYKWMTAAGDKTRVTKSGDIMRQAIIGFIITVGVYAIWRFVFMFLVKA